MWTDLLTGLACYAVAVSEANRWYRFDASLILAGDAVPVEAVGENLRNLIWVLLLFPFWWLPFGVIGAAIGSARARLRLSDQHRSRRAWRRPERWLTDQARGRARPAPSPASAVRERPR